jgi:ribosomal protein L11 methyltransferase
MLGANYVLAVDTDPMAVKIAAANAIVNKVTIDSQTVEQAGDWHKKPFDMIVANILADTLIGLADQFSDGLIDGGIYICSGIINEREDDVRLQTELMGFQALETRRSGDWVALVFRKV